MASLRLACCLLIYLLHPVSMLKIDEPISNNVSKISSQSAPYTIFGELDTLVEEHNKTSPRNVLLHLTNGTQLPSKQQVSISNNGDEGRAWMLIGPDGTIVGNKLDLNIEKLLANLGGNNFTSEIRVDHQDPTRIVNITISAAQTPDRPDSKSPIDELLLEELIMDAMPAGANSTSIYRDNHRFGETGSGPTLLRPKPPQQQVSLVTPPPIRATMEVVAENYTTRKLSEEANVFGLKLLHQVNIEKLGGSNLIQAPFAVYQGLGSLMMGAMADTARELDKVLLGAQSTYENEKLTHDQDKNRLLASFGDVLRQLHSSATHHLRSQQANDSDDGGSSEQHLIVANNLLFSPSAYEISQEFKQSMANYFNQTTSLTKIEVGSTESIQTLNGWIRQATRGSVATIIDKRQTFDEFNVMSLLSTSWLKQEWRDNFRRVVAPTRTGIRLKGQGRAAFGLLGADQRAKLLEFVDDNKQSHFVEYIQSEPSKNIHVYRCSLGNGQPVEMITVPFRDSYHRLITITPLSSNLSLLQQQQQQTMIDGNPTAPIETPPDSSPLSKLIAYLSNNPRKVMRSIWNIIAPDLITKQTIQSIQEARQKNITIDEQLVGANVIPLVQLSMPILRSGSDSSLPAALNHLGVVNTFDPYQANFIGINGHPFNYYELHLSNVIFKTTFNLNERGINYDRTIRTLESLRVHPDVSNKGQQPDDEDTTLKLEFVDDVKLNKPFVYMICDMRTKLILYTGTVRNPSQI